MSLQCTNRSVAPCTVTALVFFVLFAVSGPFTAVALAQDSAEMSATYGRGVHAYFASHMADAEKLFSHVIQTGSTDPRVYYFRAMTRLQMGQLKEAEEDMKVGAAYEARDPGNRHSIGIALQRIQGQGRRTLERFRRDGRLDRVQQRRQQTQSRYEQLQQRGPQVLRSKTPVRLEQLAKPSVQPGAPDALLTPSSVPDEVPQVGVPSGAERPTPAPAAEEEDLFSDSTPQPEEADEDPFGDAAASEPAPVEESDPPMTDDAAEEDDLFGEESPAEEADDSAGEAEPPATDEDVPAEDSTEPTAEEDDLFGGAKQEGSAEVARLTEDDKIESGKLFGILGRVVGSVAPWRNIQLPGMGLSPNAEDGAEADSLDGIALGPKSSNSGEITPASSETVDEEDLFETATPEQDLESDLFETEEETTETPAEEESQQPEDDDLFGE